MFIFANVQKTHNFMQFRYSILSKHLYTIFILLILLASIGICWHQEFECQQGKCYAISITFICYLLHSLTTNKNKWGKPLLLFTPILAWCQFVNIYRNCWNNRLLLWSISLLLFLRICCNITKKQWHLVVIFYTTCIILTYIFSHINIFMPFSLQIFDNPAGLAASLVLGWVCFIPYLHTYFLKALHNNQKRSLGCIILLEVSTFLLLICILYFQSRTGCMALILSTTFYFIYHYRRNLSSKNIIFLIVVAFILFVCLTLVLYWHNPESIKGRFLIWYTIINMCIQHPFCGWGTNAIEAHYMAAQAQILSTLNDTNHYRWLAGDVVRPFNEFLNWILRYGIIGLLLLILPLPSLLRKSSHKDRMLTTIIAWSSMGLTSYPSYYPYACLLFMGNIGVETLLPVHMILPRIFRIAFYLICLLGFITSLFPIYKEAIKEQWIIQSTRYDSAQHIPQLLSNDIDVAYTYAVNINLLGDAHKSQSSLQTLHGRLQNYDTEILTADNALTLHNYSSALKHFNIAHNMVPTRFMPLYGLMLTHLQQGDTLAARNIATIILKKKVKVNSNDVLYIQNEANELKLCNTHL